MKVLISDPVPDEAVEILKGYPDLEPDVRVKLPEDELKAIIGEYDGIIIRSGTTLDADVLECATKLKAVVRAGVGVDNVDLDATTVIRGEQTIQEMGTQLYREILAVAGGKLKVGDPAAL